MGPVKTFLNLQMSILTSLLLLQASAPAPNNKWLLLTVLLVMTAENKQKSINNNLPGKNELLNKTDATLSRGGWHQRASADRKWPMFWMERMADAKCHPGNDILAVLTSPVPPVERCNVICRLQLSHKTKKKKNKIPPRTLGWVGLNNKAAPAQVIYPDTKAIPHIN